MISLSGYQSVNLFVQTYKSYMYKALRQSDNRPVIIKVLKGLYPESFDMLVFRQLVNRVNGLEEEGILRVLDLPDAASSIALVYEDFQGNSLHTLISQGPMDLTVFFPIAAQLCTVLGDLQKNDIIHYGIKPANILVQPESLKIKLMDFGIYLLHVKEDDNLFNPEVIRSCLAYFSPEQTGRINRPMDYRTDMYSLGVTFYEMLTGTPPFVSDDPLNVIHGHLARPPLLPPGQNIQVPDMLVDITRKLLAKNPEGRYQNALGLLADLNHCRQEYEKSAAIAPFPLGQNDIAIRFTPSQTIVGRDNEVKTMRDFISAASDESRMMVVAGPPGIGKTALIYEMNKPVLKRRGFFITGKYEHFKQHVPYSAIIQALTDLIKQISSESRETFERWKQIIQKTLGPNGRVITQLIPALEMIIGPQPPLTLLDPEAENNRFNLVFLNFIRIFAHKDHPLALFLDDLHSADLPSIKLVKTMMTDPTISSFYVICSYRDNEVEPGGALSLMFDDLTQSGCHLHRLTLGPIHTEDIEHIIMDRFKTPPGKGKDMARLLHRKTMGNPCFINQCIKTMYDQGMVCFDTASGFHCDMNRLDKIQITENVVEQLSKKIMGLPEPIQDILKIGACIGNRFDLAMVSRVLGKHPGSILEPLTSAMAQGFIVLKNNMYVFSHNRIQEAAYALIPENEQPDLHYRIGRLEIDHTPDEDLHNKLFYITEHLNRGMDLIEGEDEKLRLIFMNLSCARKAKQSSAYSSGASYIDKSLQIAPPSYWQSHYDLMAGLHMERLELNFFMGQFEKVYELSNALLHHISSIEDKIGVCKIKALAYNAENRFRDTLDVLGYVQDLLGLNVKKRATVFYFLVEYIRLRIKQARRKVETWDRLPPMTDPKLLAYCNLETVTNTAVYFTNRDILTYNTLHLVHRIFKYGISPELPYYLTGIGFILIAGFNRIDLGYRFGKSGIRLLEKQSSPKYMASSYHIYNGLIRHWKEPLKSCVEDFKANYHRALEKGDLFFASYSLWYYLASHFRTGTNLLELQKNLETDSRAMAKTHQIPGMIEFNLLWACVLHLIGKSPDQTDGYRYLASLSGYHQNDDLPDTHTIKPVFYYYQAFLSIIHHRYPQAKENIEKCLSHKDGLIGVFLIRDIAFFEAVTLLALLPRAPRIEQGEYLKTIRRNLKKLRIWSKHAPENCAHLVCLVRAEYAAYRKQTKKARAFYDKAIALALNNGYIQDQAFALEKAAVFFKSIGNADKASQCIRDAARCYRKWGAATKHSDLEALYPQAFRDDESMSNDVTNQGKPPRAASFNEGGAEPRRDLDVWAILKVSRALSEEIVLENLLSKLMTLVIESAGAQRGCIIFEREGALSIEAEKMVETDTIRLESRPVLTRDTVSTTVVNLTARSQKVMLVDDAAHDMSLSHDPYVQKFKPKSVLCVPMINKGRLSALLYLENNESEGAFTPVSVDVIQLLAQQAVVSIENAKLYRNVSQSEEKYRTILESIEDGYYELDLEGNCNFGNSALSSMTGYSKEELLTLNIKDVMPPDIARQAMGLYREVRESGKPQKGFEHLVYRKDGRSLYVEGSVALITNQDKDPVGFRGLLRDITQRKESEKLLIERDVAKQASQAKSMFLANMSHEIRTPMNAILGFASLLKERVTDDKGQGFLDTILSSGRMLMMLLNDILDLSKVEAGKMTIRNTVISPSAILEDLKQTFSQKSLEKGNTMTLTVDETLPQYVVMDEIRLRQILMNLTGNAVKFTEHGTITLNMAGQAQGNSVDLEISVKDTGIGIASDQLGYIFETFEQTKDHNTAKYGGTGLGLSLSRKLAEAMGGGLTVQSRPGQGSTFTVSFPKIEIAHKSPLNDEEEMPLSDIRFEPATILVADDNQENRQIILNYLMHQPLTLIEADNGHEAVAMTDTHRPNLVLMDLFMPIMDGYEATRAIKKQHPSLPVIAVTASVLNNEEELSNMAGCSFLLRKPLEKDILIQAMTGFLPHRIATKSTYKSRVLKQDSDVAITDVLEQPLEVRSQIPELVTLLKNELDGEWKDIKEIFVTEQIQAFSDRMITLGNQYSQDTLVLWASAVKTHTSNIDMEKTFRKMEQFPDIINRIAQKAL